MVACPMQICSKVQNPTKIWQLQSKFFKIEQNITYIVKQINNCNDLVLGVVLPKQNSYECIDVEQASIKNPIILNVTTTVQITIILHLQCQLV